MKKLFTRAAAIIMGISMAAGVGVAIAAHGKEAATVDAGSDYTATLAQSSSTANYTDTKGNTWTMSYTSSGSVSVDASTWLKTGTNSVAATSISLETDAYKDYVIDKVAVHVKAKASTSAYGYIYIGGTEAKKSSQLSNTDTEVSFDNSTDNLSGTIKVAVDRGSSKTGALYLGTVTVEYSDAASEKFTVSFNGNGGTGNMDDVPDVHGNYSLPDNGFTAPSGKTFSGWKAGNTGDLLAAGSTYSVTQDVTFFAQWADAYKVTYTAGAHGTGTYEHALQPAGNYTLLPFASLSGITASAGYRFKDYTVGSVTKNAGETISLSANTSVTVNFEAQPLEATYDFTNNWSTYAKEWGGYAPHTVKGTDLDAEFESSIVFTNVSKQSSTINDRPVIAAKSGVSSTMLFTLDSSVSATYKITSVSVSFARWSTSKKVAATLYKGTTVSGTPLDSFAQADAPKTLTTANLNGDTFIVDFTTDQTSNQQLGITSIVIGLTVKASFGTLDHITITALPNVIYHVGETYDPTGLAVTAYDGADEQTANFKDVTANVTSSLNGEAPFDEEDVPGLDCNVTYTGDGSSDTKSFHVYVYALADYELVTETPSDWSGQYLLVSSYTDNEQTNHTVAINSALTNFDQPLNFKEVTINDGKITSGQELEWTVASYSDGYSMQGKNSKYAYGNSNNRFMTSETQQKLTFSLSSNVATITAADGFILRMNSSTVGAERFGFYNSGSADIQLFKLKQSDNADKFAQTFLGAFTCDNSGENKPTFAWKEEGVTRWTWALLATEYNTLTAVEKEQFRLGVASETGSNIEKAIARYDFIVGKYYKTGLDTSFTDFMSRDPKAIGNAIALVSNNNANANMIAIIVIASIALVATTGAVTAIIIKKRATH